MKTIDTNELANVTGGANFFQNLGHNAKAGATDLGNRWASNTAKTIGGPVGGISAAFAGLAGSIVGLVGGATHTLGLNNQPR